MKAAGNESDDTSYYDGSNSGNALIISAIDRNGNLASFSNYGDTIALSAPGVDIVSSVPGGGYAKLSGTSMAAPHVSGLVALLFANDPSLEPYQIEGLLMDNAIDLGPPGWDNEYGAGFASLANLMN